MNKYEKSKNWNMFIEKNNLFITKGADETYFLDDVKNEQVTTIYESYVDNSLNSLSNSNEYKDILAKLEQAGVIYKKKFKGNKKLKIFIKYFGTPNTNLKTEIINAILKRKNIEVVDKIASSDLLFLVRINEPLKNILEDYEKITVPHILIDLGYANTISIGPLVYKNETACLGCYIGRLTKNWGDPLPPVEPNITNKYELVTSFIIGKIEEYIALGNCPNLVNATWNFNVNTFSSGLDKIYKLPWCPLCNNTGDNPKLELPWINEGDYE